MEEINPIIEGTKEAIVLFGMIFKFLFTTPGLRLFVWIPLAGLIVETGRRIIKK